MVKIDYIYSKQYIRMKFFYTLLLKWINAKYIIDLLHIMQLGLNA